MLSALRPASPQSSTCLSSPCPLLLTPQGAAWFVLTLNIFKAKRIKRRDFSKVRGEGKRTEMLSPRHDPGPAVLSQAPLQEPAGYSLRAQDEELGRGGVELWKEREGPHYLSGKLSLGQSPHCHTLLAVQDPQLLCQRAQRQSCHPQG